MKIIIKNSISKYSLLSILIISFFITSHAGTASAIPGLHGESCCDIDGDPATLSAMAGDCYYTDFEIAASPANQLISSAPLGCCEYEILTSKDNDKKGNDKYKKKHEEEDDDDEHASPVPEPASFLLFASGIAGLGFYRRHKGLMNLRKS